MAFGIAEMAVICRSFLQNLELQFSRELVSLEI
jgi:hypothetical protein